MMPPRCPSLDRAAREFSEAIDAHAEKWPKVLYRPVSFFLSSEYAQFYCREFGVISTAGITAGIIATIERPLCMAEAGWRRRVWEAAKRLADGIR